MSELERAHGFQESAESKDRIADELEAPLEGE
jgi:hypothetical protein